MKAVSFGPETLRDAGRASRLEWVAANGLGGFASGTACGLSTRRYHGLLVAALNPPADRYMVLSKLDEEMTDGASEYFLSVNRYEKVLQPEGHLYLREFSLDPDPCYTYSAGGFTLKKKIFMAGGKNTVVVKYELVEAPREATIKAYPLVCFRDFHANTAYPGPGFTAAVSHENRDLYADLSDGRGRAARLHIHSDRAVFKRNENWFRGLVWEEEERKGEDPRENLFAPGRFTVKLKEGGSFYICASVEPEGAAINFKKAEKSRAAAVAKVLEGSPDGSDLAKKLTFSADSFIVERRSTGRKTVIAGYHWFSDWGRDTMIALPGLALATKRFGVAREIISTFAENIRNGVVPNRFPDDAQSAPEYNTVDASLWFVNAVYKYYLYARDREFTAAMFEKALSVLRAYRDGTDFGIGMDPDDLLVTQGAPGLQLTWMDAKVGDLVVTPRAGKPVEINALWYNALCACRALAEELGLAFESALCDLISPVKKSFLEKFAAGPPRTGLLDLVPPACDPASASAARKIRPNQIFAVSLPFSPLSLDRARGVVDEAERELLTPLGLRSLSPGDPDYAARYEGDRYRRDCAYHQGTVWAFLAGPFMSAKLRVEGYSPETLAWCRRYLEGFEAHVNGDAGLLSVSEIFDGSEPRRAAGCVSQAWSAAELLRVIYEDLNGNMRLSPLER